MQIDAIYTIFYAQKDLLLLAKIRFEKSLIFQLIPFMLNPTGVVFILMLLKLLQTEQNAIINQILNGKAIALIDENNQKMHKKLLPKSCTHIFLQVLKSFYQKNSKPMS